MYVFNDYVVEADTSEDCVDKYPELLEINNSIEKYCPNKHYTIESLSDDLERPEYDKYLEEHNKRCKTEAFQLMCEHISRQIESCSDPKRLKRLQEDLICFQSK